MSYSISKAAELKATLQAEEASISDISRFLPYYCRGVLLIITLPGYPPSVNHSYYGNKSGVYYKAGQAKDWQESVACIAGAKYRSSGADTYSGPAGFMMIMDITDNRRRDADNRLKILQDSLVIGGVIKDDAQIMDTRGIKLRGRPVKRTIAVLYSIDEAALNEGDDSVCLK